MGSCGEAGVDRRTCRRSGSCHPVCPLLQSRSRLRFAHLVLPSMPGTVCGVPVVRARSGVLLPRMFAPSSLCEPPRHSEALPAQSRRTGGAPRPGASATPTEAVRSPPDRIRGRSEFTRSNSVGYSRPCSKFQRTSPSELHRLQRHDGLGPAKRRWSPPEGRSTSLPIDLDCQTKSDLSCRLHCLP